ncbi:hypothetical protein A6R70_21365 [Agrobacterium rubi]|nr:hypothetical protein [Agrobacterium rubi]
MMRKTICVYAEHNAEFYNERIQRLDGNRTPIVRDILVEIKAVRRFDTFNANLQKKAASRFISISAHNSLL